MSTPLPALTPKDRERVESYVPMHQAKVQHTFRANVSVNGASYNRAAVSISEHCVTLAKRGIFWGFNLIGVHHFLLMDSFEFQKQGEVTYNTTDLAVRINGSNEEVNRFVRIFIKNYTMIKGILPPSCRLPILIAESMDFNNLELRLSPSQMFQCLYNAYCSLYNASYSHSVTQFVHNLITTENCVADFSRMPLNEMDGTYSSSIDLKPIFMALKYLPTIYGIQMKDVGRPDFFFAIVDLVNDSPNIRLISLEACNVTDGIPEFALALTRNPNLHLEYLDISDNPFNDLAPLAAALSRNQGDLWYLDFSNCGMSNEAVRVAMNSLISNENLWGIIHLDFRAATVREDSVELIIEYLTTVAENDSCTLRFLSFGSITTRLGDVLHTLTKYPQPIEVFYLNGCTFKDDAVQNLITFVSSAQHLQELDISDTNLKPNEIADIIRGIAKNTKIQSIDIRINSIGFNAKKLAPILEAFNETASFKWQTISLEDNGLTPILVNDIVDVFRKMGSLTGVSLSENNLDVKCILKVLTLPHLKKLWIRGTESHHVGPGLKEIFSTVKQKGIELLDISNNHIKDDGMYELQQMIERNTTLIELMIDGSHPHDIKTLHNFMDKVSHSPTIRRMKFPSEDVNYLIRRFIPKDKREQTFSDIAKKQRAVQDRLLRNQTLLGLHSDLSEQNIPELNDMLDEMSLESHDRNMVMNPFNHNAATLEYNLAFPFKSETEDQTSGINSCEPSDILRAFEANDGASFCCEKPSETKSMHIKAISIRKGIDLETPQSQNDHAIEPPPSILSNIEMPDIDIKNDVDENEV